MPVATKLSRVGKNDEELPSINSHNPLMTWSCKVMWNIRPVISLLQQGLRQLNLVGWWLTMRSFQPQICTTLWTTWPLINQKHISTTSIRMATTPGRVVTYNEKLKVRRPLSMWSCKVTWQSKYIIFPLTQWLWLPILVGWFYIMKSFFR